MGIVNPETELVADDLHGEQYFGIFESKSNTDMSLYMPIQVATLLNGYSINKINVDQLNGATVMNALVASLNEKHHSHFFPM